MLFQMAAAYLAAHDDLAARLFICAGSEEMKTEEAAMFGFTSGVTRLTELLAQRGYRSLVVESRIMDGESHHSIFPRAVMDGLLHAFGKSAHAAR